MKYIVKAFVLSLTLSLVAWTGVLAIDIGVGPNSELQDAAGGAGFAVEQTDELTFAKTLGTMVSAALSLIGIIFLVLMLYAGFLWMQARGEQDDIEKAKKIIQAAIIGLALTLGAYAITNFVVPVILARTASAG